jgi:hypothetical protein
LQAFDNDIFPRFEALPDDPEIPDLLSNFNGADGNFTVESHYSQLVLSLQFGHRPLGDQEGIFLSFHLGSDSGKLSGAKDIPRVRKEGYHLYGTGPGVDRSVGKREGPGTGMDRSIGQGQF